MNHASAYIRTMEESRCGVDVENVMLSDAQRKLRLTTEGV